MITVLTSQNKNACDIYESAIQSSATATNYVLFVSMIKIIVIQTLVT